MLKETMMTMMEPNIPWNWPLIFRGDGRVELLDSKGCGHPSEALSKLYFNNWKDWMRVHGCNGQCSTDEFTAAEQKYIKELK